ncbi:hypothetical protein OZX74_06315 [Bifidobacterium sp. ESL0798]|uniref:hypothetical protein n=1 Tax=Bifidobacterium sp. ESL0798 TaxID=2983235 RepID=UPI0023F98E91|nr:hypothetical protein [Bifidobacterium sp. ESL0798]WEV73538.1 hypothetical protein OZX74_06315 [Bifidobacterium sp. ESL0798]
MDGRIKRTSRVVVRSQHSDGVMRTDIEVSRYDSESRLPDDECFNPESCCDAREKVLIAELRELLRPAVAPECLFAKLQATLDRCCLEESCGGEVASA